jgi:hypothetical protein
LNNKFGAASLPEALAMVKEEPKDDAVIRKNLPALSQQGIFREISSISIRDLLYQFSYRNFSSHSKKIYCKTRRSHKRRNHGLRSVPFFARFAFGPENSLKRAYL